MAKHMNEKFTEEEINMKNKYMKIHNLTRNEKHQLNKIFFHLKRFFSKRLSTSWVGRMWGRNGIFIHNLQEYKLVPFWCLQISITILSVYTWILKFHF